MHELVYTSAPKGLKPGSQGFCTVACSAGMPPNLMMRLEALSAYRPLKLEGRRAELNPIVLSHLVIRVAGTDWHVLSRIADAGVDYTQRANKIAHHIVLEPSELPPAGPAALLACESRFFRRWDDEPKVITKPASFPAVQSQPQICTQWKRETGDAGWGGILALAARGDQPVVLVAKPETDVMALFKESLALLPPDVRWQTTLTTYYTRFPSGVNCRWRCVMAGSFEMSTVGVSTDAMVIDLTQPLKTPVPGPLVKAARSGKAPATFLNVGSMTELSTALADERQSQPTRPQLPEMKGENGTAGNVAETVPGGKKRKAKAKSKRKRPSQDEFLNAREQWFENVKQDDKRGLFALIVLGFVFFVLPALLLAALVSARGCNDPALQKTRDNASQHVPQNDKPLTPKSNDDRTQTPSPAENSNANVTEHVEVVFSDNIDETPITTPSCRTGSAAKLSEINEKLPDFD